MNEIETAYDQSMIINPSEFQLFTEVDNIVDSSILMADPKPALEFGRGLRRDGQLKGLALAKLLSSLDKNWSLFQRTGIEERIEDIVFVEMGVSPQTTRKYIHLWEDLFENEDVPKQAKDKLYGKSIKSLLLLTATAKDGDAVDWDRVANAENGAEIREIVRGVRGPTTSSETSVVIHLDREGMLFAKRGSDPTRYPLGRLNIADMASNPIVDKALTRLIERGGVLWE